MISVLEDAVKRIGDEQTSLQTPGFVIAAKANGKILFKKAFGMADLENGRAIKPDDTFMIASNTKQFTCFAILMLAEQGLLELDEPIGRFFPEFPAYRNFVTVRQLMCHTSGIPEYFDAEYSMNESRLRNADTAEMLKLIHELGDLEREPDTKFSYCNSGYVMLGEIIAQLSGKPFGQYLETEIFAKLGMVHSRAPDDAGSKDPSLARGYSGGVLQVHDMLMVGYADGNVTTNADDLFLWHDYLFGGSPDFLIRRETLRQMFLPHRLKDNSLVPYGLGLFLDEYDLHKTYSKAHKEIWHTGSTLGYISRVSHFPEDGLCIVMLTNDDCISRDDIFFGVADAIYKSL